MNTGIIKLCYQKLINSSCTNACERVIFEETHKEFFMQWQEVDREKKYTTFSQLQKNFEKAESMHYLVSTAAIGYLRQMNGFIPDIQNANRKLFVPFKNFKFEIIESHISDKSQHQVSISFYSEEITWINTIGSNLLVATGNKLPILASGGWVETELIEITNLVRIYSIRLPTM